MTSPGSWQTHLIRPFRKPAESVELALKATEYGPDCATYWNTLGAAYYRQENFQAALSALNRAIALDQGGTAFDHVFLAMAYHRLGRLEEARGSFTLARTEMEQSWPEHTELRHLCNEADTTLSAVSIVNPEVGVTPDDAGS